MPSGRTLALELGVVLLAGAAIAVFLVSDARSPDGPKALGQIHPPIVVQRGGWKCTTRQDGSVVIVQDPVDANGKPLSAAVNLGDGCTGVIGALIVQGNQRDGIKIGGTAHDLEVLSGWVQCGPKAGDVHQDGIQAGGGTHVHLHSIHVDCPQSNNAALFVNQTNGGSGVRPSDVTCTACDLLSANNALNVGPDSTDSGARYSLLRRGTSPSAPTDCTRLQGAGAIAQLNTCLDPNPAIDTGQPVQP